jgi:RHH-type proline utilization regulon transcriptional repressor/proline dehydrogenase/delta 1-pyrroline-5-carboxylate dehydrogenase
VQEINQHEHCLERFQDALTDRLLDASDAIYPQFATHNAATIAAILQMASKPANVEMLKSVGGSAFGVGQGGARAAGGGHGAERAAAHNSGVTIFQRPSL